MVGEFTFSLSKSKYIIRVFSGKLFCCETHKVTFAEKLLYSHRAVHVFRKSATTCASWR